MPEPPARVFSSGPSLDALSRELPNWTPECSSCVRDNCADALAACSADAGCAGFVPCRWGRGGDVSPAGEQLCGAVNGQTPEVEGSPTRKLANCWANACATACQLGSEWGCVDNYTLPPPDARGAVNVVQTLQVGFTDEALKGVSLHYCPMLGDPSTCEAAYDARACTDGLGVGRLELPIQTDDRPGWLGYRHARVPGSIDALLVNNIPVLRDRFMLQHVPNFDEQALLAVAFGTDPSLGNVIFQVFDCAHNGAEGVALEIVPAPNQPPDPATIGYQETSRGAALVAGGTRAAADGGGGIQNSLANGVIVVQATRMATGQVIARPSVRVIPGIVTLLEIHPEPAP